jgi:sugar/nucleoside kinase (ribokinase family)
MTQTNNVESAGKRLAGKSKLVVIKLGADGAALQINNKMLSVPSIPVNVVDTIGAGDAFDAGFLYGYLNRWDLKTSLRFAVICGALSTRASGGTTAQPTPDEALAFLT